MVSIRHATFFVLSHDIHSGRNLYREYRVLARYILLSRVLSRPLGTRWGPSPVINPSRTNGSLMIQSDCQRSPATSSHCDWDIPRVSAGCGDSTSHFQAVIWLRHHHLENLRTSGIPRSSYVSQLPCDVAPPFPDVPRCPVMPRWCPPCRYDTR